MQRDPLRILRRMLVLVALMVWQGGFTFYGLVVIRAGQEVLGSHRVQGFITQQVTNSLNLAGALALLLLAWDVFLAHDGRVWRRRLRWGLWSSMVLALAVLVWLHPRLDALLDADSYRILEAGPFRILHTIYLNTSTFQWACSLAYLAFTLWAWSEADRNVTEGTAAAGEEVEISMSAS
jgi:hypothetical protein